MTYYSFNDMDGGWFFFLVMYIFFIKEEARGVSGFN